MSLQVKYLSNRNYVREIPVEGKHTGKFLFSVSFYDDYVTWVIRAGNCITLLSSPFKITRYNFWNTHYFEDISRFVFWTFNKSFLLVLSEEIQKLKPTGINRCHELLTDNFIPYANRSDFNKRTCAFFVFNYTKSFYYAIIIFDVIFA